MRRRFAGLALLVALSGCGRVADLEPQAGKSLPPKPALAARTPTAEELLEIPPFADPRRVDELNKRGEVRQADRFDLPPPDGEAIPPPAAEPPSPATSGPDTQEPQNR